MLVTLHPAPYTLHPTPCTLHPCARHSAQVPWTHTGTHAHEPAVCSPDPPPLPLQSAALRLAKDTGATVTDADLARNITVAVGNTVRPAIIAECMARTEETDGNRLPESVSAPWFKSFGGINGHLLNRALTTAHNGAEMAKLDVSTRETLSACNGIEERLTHGGSLNFFVDSTWQPGPEAFDASLQGCALQYVASGLTGQRAANGVDCAGDDVRIDTSLRCPFATGVPDHVVSGRLSRLHCLSEVAGFVRNDTFYATGVHWHSVPPQPQGGAGAVRFQEASGWPRVATCAFRQGPRLEYQERYDTTVRPRLFKWVNHRRGLEFRPILKAGSTALRHLMNCLQPNEWSAVHQSVPMPANYTALVVVREPIERFASGLSEIMRRIFTGVCPDGPCEESRDAYYTHGNLDSADSLSRTSSWYRHALRLYNGLVPAASRKQVVRELIAAAVTDTSCLLDYYASEHFMTQMQLAAQGTPLGDLAPSESVRLLKLTDIGRTAEELAAGPFLASIGAEAVSMHTLEQCNRYATEQAHNTAAEGAVGNPHGASPAEARAAAQQYAHLPTEDEITAAVREEHALLLSLCHVYAQDMVCMSEHYEPPAVCRALLDGSFPAAPPDVGASDQI